MRLLLQYLTLPCIAFFFYKVVCFFTKLFHLYMSFICLQHLELRWNTVLFLCVKIVNQYFERQNFFQWRHFQSFDGGSVIIKSEKTLYTVLCKLSGRIFCSCHRNEFLHLASEKFVLASKSNLSLATGLASSKESLKPWE